MADLREEERESRWEASPAVAIVIGIQLLLAIVSLTQDWQTWDFSWWVWLIPVVPETILLVLLSWSRPHQRLRPLGIRRTVVIVLLGVVSLSNGLLVVGVIASLVEGQEKSGAQLLLKAVTVWATNVITYGLWFWDFDRGGPVTRVGAARPLPRAGGATLLMLAESTVPAVTTPLVAARAVNIFK